MSTRLRVVVIALLTIGACVSVRPDEPVLDAGARSDHSDAQITKDRTRVDAGISQPDAAGSRSRQGATLDFDAETGPVADDDAGIDELAADIALDCRETLRCNPTVAGALPSCIRAVTESLSKSPEGRARFVAIISPCRMLRGCEYVRCVERPRP